MENLYIRIFALSFIVSVSISSALEAADTDVAPYRKTSTAGNEMRIVNSGSASLYARLEMIRNAKKSINLETFIFNPDTAGRLILKELAAAAKRGVEVKILVDKSAAVFKLNEHFAEEMKAKGIEIRYYNPAPIIKISSVQFRNHRKLMSVDGEQAIVGGRNIADEYFDISKEYNFLDRDATVKGEMVKTMDTSFNNYWNSDIVQKPKKPTPPDETANIADYEMAQSNYKNGQAQAKLIFQENEEDNKIKSFMLDVGKKDFEKNKAHNCPEMAFASDKEGGNFKERLNVGNYTENYRLLRKEIAKWMKDKIKDEVVVDSPYFLVNQLSGEIASDLLKKKTKISILTNSLASTDAIYVSTVFNDIVKKYTPDENFSAYVYKGKFSGENELYSKEIENANWGTHSKTMVFSDDAFMIGTFNIDNRSSFYNTELGIFCGGSKELTADVKNNILKRMEGSSHLDTTGNPDDCSDLLGNVTTKKKVIYNLIKPMSHILQFLL